MLRWFRVTIRRALGAIESHWLQSTDRLGLCGLVSALFVGATILDIQELKEGIAPPVSQTHNPHAAPRNALDHGNHLVVAANTSGVRPVDLRSW